MQDAGVGILAGTDSPFGFFLHHELFLFVEHGLTPLQALQTATINPAKYLEISDRLGTVDEGKIADLMKKMSAEEWIEMYENNLVPKSKKKTSNR